MVCNFDAGSLHRLSCYRKATRGKVHLTMHGHNDCAGVQHKAQGGLSAVEASQQTPKALIGYAVRALPRKQFIGRVDKVWHTPIAMQLKTHRPGFISCSDVLCW